MPLFVFFKSGNANSVCWKTSLQKSSYTTLQSNGNAIKVLNLYVCLVLHFKRQFQAAKRKRRENTHLFFRSHIWAFAEGILKTLDVTCFPNSHRKWCCSNNISYQKDTNSGVGFSYPVKPCNHPTCLSHLREQDYRNIQKFSIIFKDLTFPSPSDLLSPDIFMEIFFSRSHFLL